MYADISESRFSELAKMIGGVMRPASMASECWKPLAMASTRGSSSSRE